MLKVVFLVLTFAAMFLPGTSFARNGNSQCPDERTDPSVIMQPDENDRPNALDLHINPSLGQNRTLMDHGLNLNVNSRSGHAVYDFADPNSPLVPSMSQP